MRVLAGLVVASLLFAATVVAAPDPTKVGRGPPSDGTKGFWFNFTGSANLGRTGETFQVTVNATGDVDLRTNNGNGNGKGFSSRDLDTVVAITYQDDNGTMHVAESFTTTSQVHGTFAPGLAQGLDAFRFNMHTTGRAGPILAFGLHGNTTAADQGSYPLVANGHANVKHDQGAFNYRLDGTGFAEMK